MGAFSSMMVSVMTQLCGTRRPVRKRGSSDAYEIRKKIARGYPLTNIIFEDTRQGVLFQNREEVFRANLQDASELTQLLHQFYAFLEPDINRFEQAVEEFKERGPELASGFSRKDCRCPYDQQEVHLRFRGLFTLCQTALNPNISRGAVDE